MAKLPSDAELLQQLMDTMTDNIYFKDRDSKFIMINAANARWFGFDDPREAIGKDDFDLFDPEFAKEAREDEKRILATGEPIRGKEEQATTNGKTVWGSSSKIPLRDADGEIIGIMGIGRDITELKRKEQELENAHRALQEVHGQLSADLRMAARLQETFLPRHYPPFALGDGPEPLAFAHHYEPSQEIGGDFCSVYRFSATKAGLLICDVMGHGVRAALITAMIRSIAGELAQQIEDPGDYLAAMNRRLTPILREQETFLFVTACLLTIDTHSGLVQGAIAGHPPPLVIRHHEASVTPLPPKGHRPDPALSMVREHAYHTFEGKLHPGDSLLLYTDGLTEATTPKGEELSLERFVKMTTRHRTLPIEQLIPQLIAEVHAFAGEGKLADDVCLLGCTFSPLPKPPS